MGTTGSIDGYMENGVTRRYTRFIMNTLPLLALLLLMHTGQRCWFLGFRRLSGQRSCRDIWLHCGYGLLFGRSRHLKLTAGTVDFLSRRCKLIIFESKLYIWLFLDYYVLGKLIFVLDSNSAESWSGKWLMAWPNYEVSLFVYVGGNKILLTTYNLRNLVFGWVVDTITLRILESNEQISSSSPSLFPSYLLQLTDYLTSINYECYALKVQGLKVWIIEL